MINLKDTDPNHVHSSSMKYGDVCDSCARANGIEQLWGLTEEEKKHSPYFNEQISKEANKEVKK